MCVSSVNNIQGLQGNVLCGRQSCSSLLTLPTTALPVQGTFKLGAAGTAGRGGRVQGTAGGRGQQGAVGRRLSQGAGRGGGGLGRHASMGGGLTIVTRVVRGGEEGAYCVYNMMQGRLKLYRSCFRGMRVNGWGAGGGGGLAHCVQRYRTACMGLPGWSCS